MNRPQSTSIKNRLKMILEKEKIKMDDNALELLIQCSGNDIRQMVNTLQLQSTVNKGMTYLQAKNK